MNYRYQIVWFYIFFSFYFLQAKSSEVYSYNEKIKTGKHYIYQFKLDRAKQYFDSLIHVHPEQPIPYFYRGYVKLIIYSQDMVNTHLLESLTDDFKLCIKKIKQIPEYEKNPTLLFYLGLSYGAIGAYYALDQNYIKAYWYGRKAKNYLEDTQKADSTYYDVYLGLGIYHYYVGLMPGILRFFAKILGFSGNREKGLKEIEIVARKGYLFRVEAIFSEAVIKYFLQNDLSAIKKIESLGAQYPINPVVPLLLGYHYRRNGYPGKAIAYFLKVSDNYHDLLPQLYQIKYYNLAVSHYLQNDFQTTKKILVSKLEAEFPRMTEYYQSAYNFYMGVISLMENNSQIGINYLQKIPDKKHTSFWFLTAQPFIHYSFNTITKEVMKYRNNIFCHKLYNPDLEEKITNFYASHQKDIWYYYYLDSKAIQLYLSRRYEEANLYFYKVRIGLSKYSHADYFKKWVLLHHARVFIRLKKYDMAERLIEKAKKIDDNYIKFIAEREKFMLQQEKKGRS